MKYKHLVLAAVFVISSIALARLTRKATDGFAMAKIEGTLLPGLAQDGALPPEEIFAGPLTYFARGLQCFAFLSADGQYILKVLNNCNHQKAALCRWIPGMQDAAKAAEEKAAQLFASYEIAFEALREETALLYVHLHPTEHLNKRVTLIDRLGIAHTLDLDKAGFMVQKRAKLFYPYLAERRDNGDLAGAQKAVEATLQALLARCKKGVWDNDPLFRTNFGFVEGRPVEIDVGCFSLDPASCRSGGLCSRNPPDHGELERLGCEKLPRALPVHRREGPGGPDEKVAPLSSDFLCS